VLVVAVTLAGIAASGTSSSGAATAATNGLWAVTRDATGHLHVARGMVAAVAAMDNRLGRNGDAVLSEEHDQPVHLLATNDPLRSDQWALDAVDFESAWTRSPPTTPR
jgi:hypothetical protein